MKFNLKTLQIEVPTMKLKKPKHPTLRVHETLMKTKALRNPDGTKMKPLVNRKEQRPLTKEQEKRHKSTKMLNKALEQIFGKRRGR